MPHLVAEHFEDTPPVQPVHEARIAVEYRLITEVTPALEPAGVGRQRRHHRLDWIGIPSVRNLRLRGLVILEDSHPLLKLAHADVRRVGDLGVAIHHHFHRDGRGRIGIDGDGVFVAKRSLDDLRDRSRDRVAVGAGRRGCPAQRFALLRFGAGRLQRRENEHAGERDGVDDQAASQFEFRHGFPNRRVRERRRVTLTAAQRPAFAVIVPLVEQRCPRHFTKRGASLYQWQNSTLFLTAAAEAFLLKSRKMQNSLAIPSFVARHGARIASSRERIRRTRPRSKALRYPTGREDSRICSWIFLSLPLRALPIFMHARRQSFVVLFGDVSAHEVRVVKSLAAEPAHPFIVGEDVRSPSGIRRVVLWMHGY